MSQQEKKEEERPKAEPKADDEKHDVENEEQKEGENTGEKVDKEKITLQTEAKIEMDGMEQKGREEYQKEREAEATSGNDMMAAFLARASEKSSEQKQEQATEASASVPNDEGKEQNETGAQPKNEDESQPEKEQASSSE